ncbi:MAG: hypothetical protein J2P23_09765, partial [Microlunatus sp.]|nr:hypothetical protein [Microlunatus sp.]
MTASKGDARSFRRRAWGFGVRRPCWSSRPSGWRLARPEAVQILAAERPEGQPPRRLQFLQPRAPASSAPAGVALETATSSPGTIVVNGEHLTVYLYDKDTPNSGRSSCTGACATSWPAAT